jgi:BirA family transcriptional regulator, biotin operon repressor / biotin---[acetyl-CoA-carboxylase] ligase
LVKIQPKTLFVGKNIVYLPTCHSTNDIAAEIIQNNGITDGTVIYTDYQTAGKGQRGNSWESNPNLNLTMSLILDCKFLPLKNHFFLSKIAALAVAQAIESLLKQPIKIKWPNDLYLNEKKIGGILIESSIQGKKIQYSIIGFGVNVNQTSFENPRATSIGANNSHRIIKIPYLAEKICEEFERLFLALRNESKENLKTMYLDKLFGMNELREFKDKTGTFFGKITGINPEGLLKINCGNLEKYYDIKEIEYLFNDK